MKILIDATLSHRIAHMLGAVLEPRYRVVHVRDITRGPTEDLQISEYVKANTPCLLIGLDIDVIGHPHRIAALRELACDIALLNQDWLAIQPPEHAWRLLHVMPRLLQRVEASPGRNLLVLTAGKSIHIRKLP